ncbi:hypothetical protein [Pantoea agglomerans]|nr:hypothetical protein [Pantoea agglomerans]UBN56096.1 hypothetical protein LB453_11370 [Pantoea agglomerans]
MSNTILLDSKSITISKRHHFQICNAYINAVTPINSTSWFIVVTTRFQT